MHKAHQSRIQNNIKYQKLAPYRTEGSGTGSKIPEGKPSASYGAGKNEDLQKMW